MHVYVTSVFELHKFILNGSQKVSHMIFVGNTTVEKLKEDVVHFG